MSVAHCILSAVRRCGYCDGYTGRQQALLSALMGRFEAGWIEPSIACSISFPLMSLGVVLWAVKRISKSVATPS